MSTKSFLFIAFTTVISFIFLISCESEIDEKPIAGQLSQFVLGEKDLTKREIQLSSNKKNQKYVYLTFDDGPNKGTSNVVNSLKKKNTPATLFVVGQHIYGSKAQKEDFEKIASDSLFQIDRKSTRLNSSHVKISYAVFCLNKNTPPGTPDPRCQDARRPRQDALAQACPAR